MKTLKITAFLIFAAMLALNAAAAGGDRQTRQVPSFHGISVSSGIDLYLTQGSSEEVVVEADSDDLSKIITEVEGGVLKIYIKEKSWFNLSWNNKPRKAFVTFKMIDKLEASAGSDVVSQSVMKLEKLNLDASSGSDVKLELEANEISVDSSSGSDISLKGRANTVQASASSGSDINAGDLQSKKCTASASSGSDVRVNVTEELNADASSGGDIYYSGNPKTKDINESSGGDVHGH